jgi:hypothetical protein
VWYDETESAGPGKLATAAKDGSVWVAHEGNLARWQGGKWTRYAKNPGLPGDRVTAISSAGGSLVWIGYYSDAQDSGYLVRFDDTVQPYREGLLQKRITGLAAAEKGVWIAYNSFYGAMDCNGEACPHGTLAGYADGVWKEISRLTSGILTCGPDGSAWIGHLGSYYGFHLRKYQGDELTDFDMSEITEYLTSHYAQSYWEISDAMAVTSDGNAWIDFNHGIVRINTSSLRQVIRTSVSSDKSQPYAGTVTGFPNPFNGSTTIEFDIGKPGEAEIVIYSVNGQRIRSIRLPALSAGKHSVVWNGANDSGESVSSGIYLIQVKSGTQRLIGNVTFLR